MTLIASPAIDVNDLARGDRSPVGPRNMPHPALACDCRCHSAAQGQRGRTPASRFVTSLTESPLCFVCQVTSLMTHIGHSCFQEGDASFHRVGHDYSSAALLTTGFDSALHRILQSANGVSDVS